MRFSKEEIKVVVGKKAKAGTRFIVEPKARA